MCVLDILDQNVPIDINLLNGREHTKWAVAFLHKYFNLNY